MHTRKLATPHGTWDLSSLINQGSNLQPQHWKHSVLTTGPPWKSLALSKFKNVRVS